MFLMVRSHVQLYEALADQLTDIVVNAVSTHLLVTIITYMT